MAQRTEHEIMKNWKYMAPPLVSICSTTYNHEPYIRDAIEGFLMQETEFPFEVIIHDDASTDRTAEIVKEYVAKYPNIIKPIFQTENQYSKGVKISPNFLWPKARGEYVAFCEGDDYWTNPLKLQIQILEMRKYPECEISFHPAKIVFMDGSRPNRVFGKQGEKTEVIPLGKVIRGGGDFCPTASLIVRKKVLVNLPEWFSTMAPVGDYYIQVYGAKNGGALYLDKIMAVYGCKHPTSWSNEMDDHEKNDEMSRKYLICLRYMTDDFGEIYLDDFLVEKTKSICSNAISSLKNKRFKAFKEKMEQVDKHYLRLGFMHILLYRLRNAPYVLYIGYKLFSVVRKYSNTQLFRYFSKKQSVIFVISPLR